MPWRTDWPVWPVPRGMSTPVNGMWKLASAPREWPATSAGLIPTAAALAACSAVREGTPARRPASVSGRAPIFWAALPASVRAAPPNER